MVETPHNPRKNPDNGAVYLIFCQKEFEYSKMISDGKVGLEAIADSGQVERILPCLDNHPIPRQGRSQEA